jgi:hypothetical protein
MGANAQTPPSNLTERRFRSYWERTSGGNERQRFTAVMKLMTEEIQLVSPIKESIWRDINVTLKPGFAVLEHSIFCGKDMGLTFYLHPDNATKLLPPVHDISPYERLVLRATASLKSSYNGRDRYQMAQGYENANYLKANNLSYPTREQWESAKQSLVGKGLLNKAGAVTPAGRNAANS